MPWNFKIQMRWVVSLKNTITKLPKLTQEEVKNLINTRSTVEIKYVVENSLAQTSRFTWLLGEVCQLFKEEIKSILYQFFGTKEKKMGHFSVHS